MELAINQNRYLNTSRLLKMELQAGLALANTASNVIARQKCNMAMDGMVISGNRLTILNKRKAMELT